MSDVHRRAAESAPRLTPEEISTRGFAAAFRGVSELEVRNFLKRVADELATALAREASLEAQIAELQTHLKDPPIVTEDRLLDALGEETARVLRSAQESADAIRVRAQDSAREVTEAADTAAAAARADADADAAAMRDAAQSAASVREEEAITFAAETRATAETEVAELRATADVEIAAERETSTVAAAAEIDASKEAGRELVNEARNVRERILADLGRRRMLLQAQIDELRAGRDRLLDSYRVVKRTLGDATDALVRVEERAAAELAGPPPPVEVPPVDGELAALAGELTGELGPISADVEALFARLREQSAGPPGDDDVPAPLESVAQDPGPEPASPLAESAAERTAEPAAETTAEPEPASDPDPEPEAVIDLVAPEPEPTPDPAPAPDVARTGAAAESTAPATTPAPAVDELTDIDIVVLTGVVSDGDARAGRENVLTTLHRELGRKVKRALQDEQNDVLDRIRTVKGRPVAGDVLPTSAAQVVVLATTLRGPVDAAYGGGRTAAGAAQRGSAPSAMVDGLAATMVERLHERLVDAIDGASDDDVSITQRLGARYREFKGQELEAIVGDTLAAAWALGVYDATPSGRTLRWVAAAEGQCPDCDDNALEPTVKGAAFPTGQPHPPAHPGCRCLLVPAE